MAHYAGLDSENNILTVFTGKNEDEATPDGFADWEEYYLSVNPAFSSVKRTSYNTKNGKYYNQNEEGVHVLASEADQSKAEASWGDEHRIAIRCDRILKEVAKSKLSVNEAVSLALIARHFKRIVAHLTNIATSVILPLSELDYFDEKRELE